MFFRKNMPLIPPSFSPLICRPREPQPKNIIIFFSSVGVVSSGFRARGDNEASPRSSPKSFWICRVLVISFVFFSGGVRGLLLLICPSLL